jgi:hypothetical protein
MQVPGSAWMQVQDRAEDWSLGSRGCYDAVSLTRLQMQLRYDFEGVAQVPAAFFNSCTQHILKPTSQWWNIVSATLQRPCCTRH